MTLQMHYQEKYEQGVEYGMKRGVECGMERGVEQGTIRTLISLVQKKLLTVSAAAEQAGISEQKFLELMEKE